MKEVWVRGEDGLTELEYYARIARPVPVSYTPECGRCGGAGYLRHHRPLGSWLFGKYEACPECKRGEQKEHWWQKE